MIEVVLALGICAFAVIPVMGLLPVALGSAGQSLEMVRRAKVIQQVTGDLQRARFSELETSTANQEWTFDVDGLQTTDPLEIYYTVKGKTPETVALPGARSVNPDLKRIVLEIDARTQDYFVPIVIANRGD